MLPLPNREVLRLINQVTEYVAEKVPKPFRERHAWEPKDPGRPRLHPLKAFFRAELYFGLSLHGNQRQLSRRDRAEKLATVDGSPSEEVPKRRRTRKEKQEKKKRPKRGAHRMTIPTPLALSLGFVQGNSLSEDQYEEAEREFADYYEAIPQGARLPSRTRGKGLPELRARPGVGRHLLRLALS